MSVVIAHDYLTQRGGAERVVLSMLRAFPGAPLQTSLYQPEDTFPEFATADVRTLPLNALGVLRRNHRLALPLLAAAFSKCHIRADVVLCSSSGWAHGVEVEGRKIVYCYSPARWLYQPSRYLGAGHPVRRYALGALRSRLIGWDQRKAATADAYLAPSRAVAARIRGLYGIEAAILPPPHSVDPYGPVQAVPGLEPGFVLCISRLLAYKNLEPVVEAFTGLRGQRLVVVGTGPESRRLLAKAPPNVRFVGAVCDDELRWLYGQSVGLVAAAYEDFGLTPIEAAAFGKPAAVLRWGGFLDTMIEGHTGVFFDEPDPGSIRLAVRAMTQEGFEPEALQAHAARYSEDRFIAQIRRVVLGDGEPPAAKMGVKHRSGWAAASRLRAGSWDAGAVNSQRDVAVGKQREETCNVQAMEYPPADLYLDLLTKALTRTIGHETYRPLAPSKAYLMAVSGAVNRLAKLFGVEMVRRCGIEEGVREHGLDWPADAETMVGVRRLDNIRTCVETVLTQSIPGDLIETGVWRGGSTIFMRAILAVHQIRDRTVWVADSFHGLPKADPRYAKDAGDLHHTRKALQVSLEDVQENFRRYGLLDEQVRFLPGWFSESLPTAPIESLAVLRLDGDMYGSTMDALILYEKVSPGGFVIVDDYGLRGCRAAIDDFREQRAIAEELTVIDNSGAVYWRKDA